MTEMTTTYLRILSIELDYIRRLQVSEDGQIEDIRMAG